MNNQDRVSSRGRDDLIFAVPGFCHSGNFNGFYKYNGFDKNSRMKNQYYD